MIKYAKLPGPKGIGSRFTKNNRMVKESRVPPEVLEKLEYATEIEYDDKPERRRCIFCDAYQSRQRLLDGKLIDLCEWHYQHARLGQIAHRVVEKKQEDKLEAEKIAKLTPAQKRKRTIKLKKTALSEMLS